LPGGGRAGGGGGGGGPGGGGGGWWGAQGHSLGLRLFRLAPPWCRHLDGDPAYRVGPGRRSPCAPILRGCRQVPIVAGWLATGRRLVQLGPCLGLRGRGGPGSPHFGGLGPPPGRAAGACWVGPARSPKVRGRHVYAVANRGTGVREHGPPRGRGASRERFPPPAEAGTDHPTARVGSRCSGWGGGKGTVMVRPWRWDAGGEAAPMLARTRGGAGGCPRAALLQGGGGACP